MKSLRLQVHAIVMGWNNDYYCNHKSNRRFRVSNIHFLWSMYVPRRTLPILPLSLLPFPPFLDVPRLQAGGDGLVALAFFLGGIVVPVFSSSLAFSLSVFISLQSVLVRCSGVYVRTVGSTYRSLSSNDDPWANKRWWVWWVKKFENKIDVTSSTFITIIVTQLIVRFAHSQEE